MGRNNSIAAINSTGKRAMFDMTAIVMTVSIVLECGVRVSVKWACQRNQVKGGTGSKRKRVDNVHTSTIDKEESAEGSSAKISSLCSS